MMERAGYYFLNIIDERVKKRYKEPFEIYVEQGKYDIKVIDSDSGSYPDIISSSPIQNELTAFYRSAALLKDQRAKIHYHYNKLLHSKQAEALSPAEFSDLAKQEAKSSSDERQSFEDAFKQFIRQYPQIIAAPHILAGLDYNGDPATYYNLFKQLSEAARNSVEGKEIGDKLSRLVKLVPGQQAPDIAGTTPDGHPFKISDLKKKIYLVEVWKSADELSRLNHNEASIANLLSVIPGKADFGIISISLDHKRDWWTGAILDDKLTWPQYSDLKGNDSANVLNWSITRIPAYFLVDGRWHIIEHDAAWSEVPVIVNQYLAHH